MKARLFSLGIVALTGLAPVHAQQPTSGVPVRVVQRDGRPAPALTVRALLHREGTLTDAWGERHVVIREEEVQAQTDRNGLAWIRFPDSLQGETFAGTVDYTARIVSHSSEPPSPLGDGILHARLTLGERALDPQEIPTLRLYELPDTQVDGFPVWLAAGGRPDKVVVLLEGFDLYNGFTAADNMRLIGPAADALRARGYSILVVNFPDSDLTSDQLAPIAARAIRAGAQLSGHEVAVAGLSSGGIVGRWALVEAENQGQRLPVHTLLCLDTPNRGANISPGLQAMVLRYGKKSDIDALTSPAARILLSEIITAPKTQVQWKAVGPPLAQRSVPLTWTTNNTAHTDFYARLRQLNDRGGYPKQCRIVGIANSARQSPGGEGDLLRLWLPWFHGWTQHAATADHAPGSLLPQEFVNQFTQSYPLGIAGAYLKSAPTFLPCASALDAAPGEVPPFDAWFARREGLPALAHNVIDPEAGLFVLSELKKANWRSLRATNPMK